MKVFLKLCTFLTLILLLYGYFAKAQLPDGWYEPINSATIEYENSWVRFQYLATSNYDLELQSQLLYYWYFKDIIHVTRGGHSGKLLHNDYVEYYNNNNLEEKGRFFYGLQDGIWTRWYDNGLIKEITPWKKGIIDGIYQEFNLDGSILKEINYRNGQLHGKAQFFEGNKLIYEKKYKKGKEVTKRVKHEETKPTFSDSTTVIY